MKKIIIATFLVMLVLAGCKKSILEQVNPNKPTLESLKTEGGITSFALGIFEKWLIDIPNSGRDQVMVIAWTQQSILGDELFSPYGNYGFRWTNQVYSIKLPNGNTIVNPNGIDQKTNLQSLNSRGALDRNAFQYEWSVDYLVLAQANLLRAAADDPALTLSGDAQTKRNTLKAWAYWWRGYSYSRIGSLYLSGVINGAPANGTTTDMFVDHNAIIAEANKNFDSCIAILSTTPDNGDYMAMMDAIIPSVFRVAPVISDFKSGDITPDMWIRQIYTYEARNLLANKKVKDMTTANWSQITTLTDKGLQQSDNIFLYALDPNLVNDVNGQFQGNGSPYTLFGDGNQFTFTSERLIQDFKAGDQRFTKGFYMIDTPNNSFNVNIRGRGLQFGSRFNPVSIEDGGLYATNNNSGVINIGTTWDENALMSAEAKIRTGDIEGGLALIDAVRVAQGAGLAPVKGKGLTLDEALEELRRERRIGLFLRGVAFYDARRWGITDPVSVGGGRNGGIVLVPADVLGLPAGAPPQALPTLMDYRYMDYWDVPQNELDFNSPGSGSSPVKN